MLLLLALAAAPLSSYAAATSSIPQSAWTQLNSTVGGRLHQGIPFARSCFTHAAAGVGGTQNAAACATIQANYINTTLLQDNLGGYINTQWETCQATSEQCLLDFQNTSDPAAFNVPSRICSQGSVPDYGIKITGASDVLAAYAFSKAHGVPLVVKGTGHEYKGRSGAPGSLAIWTHGLKSITNAPKFVPTNCPKSVAPRTAVTIGAGVMYEELIDFADANSLTIPAGGCISVGAAGGYPQGGGHSMFSNTHGLAADRVLEIEVVTPRGDHLIANQCQNTDIFWAMRGGGGGTFGVTLSMTTLTFPATQVNGVFAIADNSVPGQRLAFFQWMVDNAISLAQQGWGYYLYPTIPGIAMSNTVLSQEEAEASIAGLKTLITQNFTGASVWEMTLEPNYKTYYPKYVTNIAVPVGVAMTVTSRLIPVANFQTEKSRAELAQAMTALIDEVPVALGFGVAPFVHGNNNDTSVNPAWYESLWHLALATTWNFNETSSSLSTIYSDLSSAIDPFRALAPNSGAYVNEADIYEPDWEQSFWGDNYARLLSIKQKYDPNHLLDCWQCVGWNGPKDARYKCYINIDGV
ncbi:FAD-binding domain-containing protein [Roridomyces roridus]|uniref:FAD-binding domain-containing protein n=1 Tax=Roridomyces roridus TaxID=1738132 RepID=A0AAD7FFT8_9AGAR|nr:FAD-binding domain-containing protein [Roridomyces roridus]